MQTTDVFNRQRHRLVVNEEEKLASSSATRSLIVVDTADLFHLFRLRSERA